MALVAVVFRPLAAMTLTALTVAAALACLLSASPSSGSVALVPDYTKAYSDRHTADAKVLELISANEPAKLNNETLDYLLLWTVVVEVSNQMAAHCVLVSDYNETYYIAVNKSVTKLVEDPIKAKEDLVKMIHLVGSKTLEVDKLLNNLRTYSNQTNITDYNEAIFDEENKNPARYRQPTLVLLALGELAELYLKNTYENKAKDNSMLDFILTDGINELRPIIDSLTQVKEITGFYPPCTLTIN